MTDPVRNGFTSAFMGKSGQYKRFIYIPLWLIWGVCIYSALTVPTAWQMLKNQDFKEGRYV